MNKVYKSILSVAAVAIVAGATMMPTAVNAWGDSVNGRTVYTIDQINSGALGNTITFNSISNGKIGDERNFVGARKGTAVTGGSWNADSLTVSDGDVITVRLYVHNNSPKGTEAVATGVSASFSLPSTVGKEQTIIGYLNSSNATPDRYWDEVVIKSDDDFFLEYVEGSAKYVNTQGTFSLSDNIVTSGATLGYTSMNGEVPGCYDFDGQAVIQLKVHKSVTAKVSKTVRIKGDADKTWKEVVTAKVGDEVEYQIEYVNLLNEDVYDVMIRDVLPTNMEYVAGSTYLYNASHQSGVKLNSDAITGNGVNIGNYVAKGNAFVRFTAKVVDKTLACGQNQLVNWAASTVNGKVVKDDASVMVAKTDGKCVDKPADNNTTTDNPSRIVDTGATDVVLMGALGAGSVVTALGYFVASRKRA